MSAISKLMWILHSLVMLLVPEILAVNMGSACFGVSLAVYVQRWFHSRGVGGKGLTAQSEKEVDSASVLAVQLATVPCSRSNRRLIDFYFIKIACTPLITTVSRTDFSLVLGLTSSRVVQIHQSMQCH